MAIVGWLSIVAGSLLALLAAVGLQRFDDVFARMHAATKPATLGLVLVLGGASLIVPGPGVLAKLFLVILLQFVTAPVAAHLVGRAAYRTRIELSPDTEVSAESDAFLSRRR